MKLKPLVITTTVLAVGALVTHFATRPPALAPDDPREGQPLVPPEVLEHAARIKVAANGQSAELVRDADGGWITPTYHDLPVDFTKLQTLTDSLGEAKLVDLVTRRPERIARLDLESTTVAITDGGGKEWALGLGKTSTGGARFVRLGNEVAAFTSDFSGWIDGNPKSWADSSLLSLKQEEVKAFNVTLGDGTQVEFTRENADADFSTAALPEGRTLSKGKVTSLLSTLTSIRFSDTVSPDDPEVTAAREHTRAATLKTFDGKAYTVTFMKAPQDPVPSPAPSATPAPAKEKPVYVKVETADPAARLNTMMQKRAFVTYAYTYSALPADWSALSEASVSQAPTPTPAPATPASS